MRHDFVLIDLNSQAEAVETYVKDWTPDQVMEWMSIYGEVILHFEQSDRTCYVHISNWNLSCSFVFDDDGQLDVLNFEVRR